MRRRLGECQLRGRRRDQATGGGRRAAKTREDGGDAAAWELRVLHVMSILCLVPS